MYEHNFFLYFLTVGPYVRFKLIQDKQDFVIENGR